MGLTTKPGVAGTVGATVAGAVAVAGLLPGVVGAAGGFGRRCGKGTLVVAIAVRMTISNGALASLVASPSVTNNPQTISKAPTK